MTKQIRKFSTSDVYHIIIKGNNDSDIFLVAFSIEISLAIYYNKTMEEVKRPNPNQPGRRRTEWSKTR